MSKRTASRELTHENWEAEDEQEEMGTFRQASDEQLAGRLIKKASRRRGTNGESGTQSVFKGLSVFPSFNASSTSSSPPAFSFLSSVSKVSSETTSSKVVSNTKSETEKATQPFKVTQDSFFSSVKVPDKANGFKEGKAQPEEEGKRDGFFLSNLKALNEGVLVWIQKHLDTNPHVNLTPVFDDYKQHFSELLKKYPPELGSSKDSEEIGGPTANTSKMDPASGKENTTPLVVSDVSKESATVKPFTFGIQTSAVDEKSSESVKSIFTFGLKNSPDNDKKASPSSFSFTGFGSTGKKSEGLVFGNSSHSGSSSSSSSSATTTTTTMFGGFNSMGATKSSGTGVTFSSGSSSSAKTTKTTTPPAATEKKKSEEKAEEPSDEPPKVEVHEIKEDDALYEKKCKLFYMKDGAYVDRGVGTLYLKAAAGDKTQLLVRAYTNLGNILLNIVLNASIPAVRAGKNGVLIVCVPNPPLESSAEKSKDPIKMLIRVKTSEDADTLLEKIEEYKK